ncbi:CPBP family intramembrane glutamic endopeptidase [Gemella cuniculi]|uniref:CPBP family intramembrane glutamic endopeptidase n=1 Tax=Gemella cuniculi TaxID=150240 RepID=UPI0003F97C18|nr:CPBP family intramembrane glutamic endopeptidase [Gemella cuniculi]
MKQYTLIKFNILLLSTLILILLGNIYLSVAWILSILILFDVRKIPKKGILYLIRLTGYFIHFIIIFLTYVILEKKQVFIFENEKKVIFILFTFIIISILKNKKTFSLFFSNEYVSSIPKENKIEYIYSIYVSIGCIIGEELYFRYFMIENLKNIGSLSILISAVYFMLIHYLLPWGDNFNKKDLLNQVLFGLVSGGIYYISNSILFCIVGHLFMNIHMIIFYIKSYSYYYVKKGEYIDSKNIFDELDV